MPVQIHETDERFWRYLLKLESPVTAEKVARRFLVSKSHAARALNYFVAQGLADVIKIGTTKYYRVKE